MWLASLWSFVFQTVKEAGAEGKHSEAAHAEVNVLFYQCLQISFRVDFLCFVVLFKVVYVFTVSLILDTFHAVLYSVFLLKLT